jgi:hypothetical protein
MNLIVIKPTAIRLSPTTGPYIYWRWHCRLCPRRGMYRTPDWDRAKGYGLNHLMKHHPQLESPTD